MNNQQKYLGIGVGGALAVVVMAKLIMANSRNEDFLMLIIAAIVAGMMYLVFNIFVTTQTLVPVKVKAQQQADNKKA